MHQLGSCELPPMGPPFQNVPHSPEAPKNVVLTVSPKHCVAQLTTCIDPACHSEKTPLELHLFIQTVTSELLYFRSKCIGNRSNFSAVTHIWQKCLHAQISKIPKTEDNQVQLLLQFHSGNLAISQAFILCYGQHSVAQSTSTHILSVSLHSFNLKLIIHTTSRGLHIPLPTNILILYKSQHKTDQ